MIYSEKSAASFSPKVYKDYLFAVCSIAAVLICGGSYTKICTIVAFCISACFILASDTEKKLYMLLFLLPFSPAFKLSSDGVSLFTVLVALYCIISFMKSKNPTEILLLLVILSAYLFLNGSFDNTGRSLDILLGVLLIGVVFSNKPQNIDVNTLIRYFSAGVILACIVSLLSEYLGIFPEVIEKITFVQYDGTEYSRFRALYGNSNYFSLDVTIAVSCFLALLCKNKRLPTVDWIAVVFLVLFGFMSASLSFFISLLLIAVFALIYFFRANPWKLLSILIFTGIGFLFIYYVIGTGEHSALWVRIQQLFIGEETAAQATTGRSELWKTYWQYLVDHPMTVFFGDGLNAPYIGGGGRGSHNTYLDLIYYIGIFGIMLFAACIVRSAKRVANHKRKPLYVFIPLLALLIRAFAISILTINNLYFYLILVILAFTMPDETLCTAERKIS